MKHPKDIYMDYAAATPVDERVVKAMRPYWSGDFANPSSTYLAGTRVRQAVDKARRQIAKILSVREAEIIFTSSGTESINLAIAGVAGTYKKPAHMIVSQIEHDAVMDPIHQLERTGWEISYLAVKKSGLINPASIKPLIRKDTVLISVGYVNNEIGIIQPISSIGKLAKQKGILFHTDACQASLLSLAVNKLNVDLLTLNAAKHYGPKGAAILFKRKGLQLQPQILGGGQEQGWRSGTENVPAIIGMAEALRLTRRHRVRSLKQLKVLENHLVKGLKKIKNNLVLNGDQKHKLPGLINVQLPKNDAQKIMAKLSRLGVFVSLGAACQVAKNKDSHVLTALGLKASQRHTSLRFSLGADMTVNDIDLALKICQQIIK
ncbi:cysteine desulfurase family protein [Patescibacteria group bacterium]